LNSQDLEIPAKYYPVSPVQEWEFKLLEEEKIVIIIYFKHSKKPMDIYVSFLFKQKLEFHPIS